MTTPTLRRNGSLKMLLFRRNNKLRSELWDQRGTKIYKYYSFLLIGIKIFKVFVSSFYFYFDKRKTLKVYCKFSKVWRNFQIKNKQNIKVSILRGKKIFEKFLLWQIKYLKDCPNGTCFFPSYLHILFWPLFNQGSKYMKNCLRLICSEFNFLRKGRGGFHVPSTGQIKGAIKKFLR